MAHGATLLALRIAFKGMELAAFVLPALPRTLAVRLAILLVYYAIHAMGGTHAYTMLKRHAGFFFHTV